MLVEPVDEASFRSFFAAQFDDVWRFARRRCTSSDRADDVTAETFAVAWRRRHELPPDPEVRLWLFGTARLVLANQRRSDRRRAGLHDRLVAMPAPRSPHDPADLVADADTDRQLWTALASLADDDRDLLVMRAWDELAVTDIAVLLGCTPNAASVPSCVLGSRRDRFGPVCYPGPSTTGRVATRRPQS